MRQLLAGCSVGELLESGYRSDASSRWFEEKNAGSLTRQRRVRRKDEAVGLARQQILVCQHTLAAFYEAIRAQVELGTLCATAGLLRSLPSALWPLRPTAVSVRRLHILLSVLCSLAQARSSHRCTLTPTDAGHGRLRACISRQMVMKRLMTLRN